MIYPAFSASVDTKQEEAVAIRVNGSRGQQRMNIDAGDFRSATC